MDILERRLPDNPKPGFSLVFPLEDAWVKYVIGERLKSVK